MPRTRSCGWSSRKSAARRCIARREEREGQVVYRIEFRLQGDDETVFFDV